MLTNNVVWNVTSFYCSGLEFGFRELFLMWSSIDFFLLTSKQKQKKGDGTLRAVWILNLELRLSRIRAGILQMDFLGSSHPARTNKMQTLKCKKIQLTRHTLKFLVFSSTPSRQKLSNKSDLLTLALPQALLTEPKTSLSTFIPVSCSHFLSVLPAYRIRVFYFSYYVH